MPRAERAHKLKEPRERTRERVARAQHNKSTLPNVSAGLGGGGATEPSLCVMIIHLEGYQFENRGGCFERGAKTSFQKRRSQTWMNMMEAIQRPFAPWSLSLSFPLSVSLSFSSYMVSMSFSARHAA